MPELPEVETVVRGIRSIVDRPIRAIGIDRPDIVREGITDLSKGLIGRRVAELDRLGKRILMRIEGGGLLVVHLGMTGRLLLEPVDLAPAIHTHVRMTFEGLSEELRFRDPRRFGGLWYFPAGANGHLKALGPDALSIRVPVLGEITKRRRQIKALLMDQQVISGLGNIYCDEALFSARIHPLTIAATLKQDQIKDLACSIRKILRASIESGGSTLSDYRRPDGREGEFQQRHRVYDREGKPCVRCGAKVRRILAAGRSTHFCPKCQRRKSSTNPARGQQDRR